MEEKGEKRQLYYGVVYLHYCIIEL